jgi:hypothetical protein
MMKARREAVLGLKRYDKQLGTIYRRLTDEVLDVLDSAAGARRWQQRQVISALAQAAKASGQEVEGLMSRALLDAGRPVVKYTAQGLGPYEAAMGEAGLRVDMATVLFRVPQEAVAVLHARTYSDGLYLSDRIWNLTRNSQRGLQRMVIDGLAKGLHYDDPRLAEQAKRFLQPARLGKKVKPQITRTLKDGTKYTFRQRPVSFDAARLLRTEYMSAFREAGSICAEKNPACEGEQWLISEFHPDIGCACEDYATHDEGLGEGVYKVGDLPITPHPSCLCTSQQVTVSLDEFMGWCQDYVNGERNQIAEWWDKYGMEMAA